MVFFDLSILYQDPEAAPSAKQAEAAKAGRLKAVVKAMELGYTGVAYDRHISGFMSDNDRCMIAPFPLSSLLKAAPGLSASVRFHRELLGVPLSAPFRQYRRLTVAVKSAAQAAALNAGNPVLKTYDLVAVRPLSQSAFELACKTSEVHLISINFSQKLPFRLKGQLPNVQEAIKRGVYFEICYSHLIDNTQSRRQMLSGAKILVDCTRGKNIIFSSAATSADQIRGPCDVANMSYLFSFSVERAKTSISKNCRSLLISAFRKKQFFMGAIEVEKITSKDHKLEEERCEHWSSWDPLSSGEGDLPSVADIDMLSSDMVKVPRKCFSASLVTARDDMAPQSKSLLWEVNTDPFGSNRSLFSVSEKPYFFPSKGAQSNEKLGEPIHELSSFAGCFADNNGNMLSVNDMSEPVVTEEGDMVISDGICVKCIPIEVASLKDRSLESKLGTTYLNSNLTLPTSYEPSVPINSDSILGPSSIGALVTCIPSDICMKNKYDEMVEDQLTDDFMEINKASSAGDTAMSSDQHSVFTRSTEIGEHILMSELPQRRNVTPIACNMAVDVCATKSVSCEEPDGREPTGYHILIEDFEVKVKESVVSDENVVERDGLVTLARQEEENTASVRNIQLHKHKSGKAKVVKKLKHQMYQLPFKGLLKPALFKKKGQLRKASRKCS